MVPAAAEDALAQRKRAVRRKVIAARDALPESSRQLDSELIHEHLLACEETGQAQAVLAYVSMGSEVRTGTFLRYILQQGKRLALPRVNRAKRCLDLFWVRDLLLDLEPGTWGILEPQPKRCEAVTDTRLIDVVLVPGVAFTPACERMGYGGGFYDKLLGGWQGERQIIAGAFDLQIVEDIPTGPMDVGVDRIVTPTRRFLRQS
ncbi:MAG: 5-formyltetrahydrofolate cyclo-ligase [Burkholderiales bacterium]